MVVLLHNHQEQQDVQTLVVAEVEELTMLVELQAQAEQAVQVSWSLEQMQVKELHYQLLLAVQFLILEIQQVV
jgi:hypothetical protein